MPTRLSALDASFLRAETANAHMHVAWRGIFRPHPQRPRPSLTALREAVAARLEHVPRFRQRLAHPALGVGEPFWVDDEGFAIANHVLALSRPDERLSPGAFQRRVDAALSAPLDRERPLWRILLAPHLRGGATGVLCQIHHALVDGKSAVELGVLLFDVDPDAKPGTPARWEPRRAPGSAGLALRSLTAGVEDSLGAARGIAGAARRPGRSAARIGDTLRRTALAVDQDLLRAAPPSYLNVPIGPRRTLASHRAPLDDLMALRRATGTSFNDVCLAVVAGGLREFALTRSQMPRPLRAMVPVSVRADDQRQDLGNRISFAFVDLPVDVGSPERRLALVHEQTSAFKRSGRTEGTRLILGAAGALPAPLKDRAARLASSPRLFNLTVSNVPGPREPLYMLGAKLLEAHPVVPIAEDHALSIGIFTYRDSAFFGLYADPDALPGIELLAPALNSSMLALSARVSRSLPAQASAAV